MDTMENMMTDEEFAKFMNPPSDGLDEVYDDISHPQHYTQGVKHEPKDVIRLWGLNYNVGAAVKYISRAGRKPGNPANKDLRKAAQYIKFELEWLNNGGVKDWGFSGNTRSGVEVPLPEEVATDWEIANTALKDALTDIFLSVLFISDDPGDTYISRKLLEQAWNRLTEASEEV